MHFYSYLLVYCGASIYDLVLYCSHLNQVYSGTRFIFVSSGSSKVITNFLSRFFTTSFICTCPFISHPSLLLLHLFLTIPIHSHSSVFVLHFLPNIASSIKFSPVPFCFPSHHPVHDSFGTFAWHFSQSNTNSSIRNKKHSSIDFTFPFSFLPTINADRFLSRPKYPTYHRILSPPLNLIHSFIILNLLRAYIAVSCLHVSFFSFLFGSLARFLIVTLDLHVYRTRGGCPALACRLRFIPRVDMKSALHLRGLRSPPLVSATPSRLLETRVESTPPLCSFSCSCPTLLRPTLP